MATNTAATRQYLDKTGYPVPLTRVKAEVLVWGYIHTMHRVGRAPTEVNVMATKEMKGKGSKAMRKPEKPRTMTPWDEMEHWFDEFGRRGWLHPLNWEWPRPIEAMAPFEGRMPKVDLIDRETEIVVRAELPGVSKDDVEVTLTEDSVTIEAHTTKETEEKEEGKYYRREMSHGDFRRSLSLPTGVDEDKAKAAFTDGVLELTLPKLEKAQKRTVRVE
jgi:HSP20 family protein